MKLEMALAYADFEAVVKIGLKDWKKNRNL